MNNNEIKKGILKYGSSNQVLWLILFSTTLLGLYSIFNSSIVNTYIQFIFSLIVAICLFLVSKNKPVGFLIIAIIFVVDAVFILFALSSSRYLLFGLMIKIMFIITLFQAFFAVRKIPKNVDIISSVKETRKNRKRIKQSSLNQTSQAIELENATRIVYFDTFEAH